MEMFKGYGYRVVQRGDGGLEVRRRPTFGQWLQVVLTPIIGGFCTLAGFVAQGVAAGLGVILLTLVLWAVFLQGLLGARRDRFSWSPNGVEVKTSRWFKTTERQVPVDELDAQCPVRLVATTYNAPGSRKMAGCPSTLTLRPSDGGPPFAVYTVHTDLPQLEWTLRSFLPGVASQPREG